MEPTVWSFLKWIQENKAISTVLVFLKNGKREEESHVVALEVFGWRKGCIEEMDCPRAWRREGNQMRNFQNHWFNQLAVFPK